MGSADNVLATLQEAARRDLGDFMTFEVGPDDDHPEIQTEGMVYEGLRFRADGSLGGLGSFDPCGPLCLGAGLAAGVAPTTRFGWEAKRASGAGLQPPSSRA
jgi:hypothetical protein